MRGTTKIDWLNHAIEFVVVVIGILLAFQLNTCRDVKKEDKIVQQHINNVLEETQFNKDRISESINYSQQLLDAADTLLAALQKGEDLQKINGLSFRILKFSPIYIKENSYNNLKESGDIRFIKDFKLKENIISLYEYYNWAEGVDQMSFSNYQEYYYPYLVENFDMITGSTQAADVYLNPYFKNIVSGYRYGLNSRLTQSKVTLEKIENFLETYQKQ